jgi:WD40 repeat protein
MPNGDTLNWDAFREVIGWSDCERGYPGTQNIKILPDPAYEDGYYIIHKARKYNGQFEDITFELRHSYVDMQLDGGMGDVVYYDSILYDAPITNANLEAIPVDNGEDWWILQPIEDESLFLTYKLGQGGIGRFPDQNSSVLFADKRSGAGTMRISPDGTKLACYEYFLNLHVYDFNRSTGQISNHQKVTLFDDAEDMPNSAFRFGSVEWSPNSRFMYVAVWDSLFQVDSWEEDMNSGIRLIDVYDGTSNPFPNTFYVASLAPDCKIYICSTNGNRTYHVIHNPDELGTACNFVQNGLQLPQNAGSANLPLFPRFRVDEEEKCDPSITSVFGQSVFYRRDLQVYPNPSNGRYIVEAPETFRSGWLAVISPNGSIIDQQKVASGAIPVTVDITNHPAGLYHIELYPKGREDKVFWSEKVVKQ